MRLISGGSFDMGSADGRDIDRPVHRVSVASFWMDRTEATVLAYRQCVDAGGCTATGIAERKGCNWPLSDRSSHPINCVDWEQARAFCQWANKRLPTEPESEYAARGGSEGRVFPWGITADSSRACFDTSETCQVGSFPAGNSKDGLQDMAGNVWEWTATAFCRYEASGCKDPNPDQRVRRGGSFYTAAIETRSALRTTAAPAARDEEIGFRCAVTAD